MTAIIVHDPEECEGHHCPFHNPSDHALKDAPCNVRFDRPVYNQGLRQPVGYLTERLCEHGIGHPDPDSLAYLISRGAGEHEGTHGCCGCCHSNDG